MNNTITLARIHYNPNETAATRDELLTELLKANAGKNIYYSDAVAASLDYTDAADQYANYTATRCGNTWTAGGVFLEHVTMPREDFDAMRAAGMVDAAIYWEAFDGFNAEIMAYCIDGEEYDGRRLPWWDRPEIDTDALARYNWR